MFRTGLAILLSWIACTAVVYWLRDPAPWLWFTVIDALACVLVTIRPAGRMQSVIGGFFAGAIVCHFLYGVSNNPDMDHYLNGLTLLKDMQLAIYGAWLGGCGCVWLAHYLGRHWLRVHPRFPDAPTAPRLGW